MRLKLNTRFRLSASLRRRLLALLSTMVLILPILLGATMMPPAQRLSGSVFPSLIWPPDRWTVDTLLPTFRWQSDGYAHLWVAPLSSATPLIDQVLGLAQDNYTLATPLQPNTNYKWRVRSNPFPPSQSVYSWGPWSQEFTFLTAGALTWQGGASVQLMTPKSGTLASTLTPTLTWTAPAGSTHFQMIIVPVGNDGAAVKFVQTIGTSYTIPGPPKWYGVLPNTSYYWRVRVNNATDPVPDDHPSWGPWSVTWTFTAPAVSGGLEPISPVASSSVTSVTPTLTWSTNNQLYYFEIQISKDSAFTLDPSKATAPVYWETIHGGLSMPKNSYTVSKNYSLERGKTYYWRVRPATMQAAQFTSWSPTWTFTVK